MTPPANPRVVVITGASSGIGAAAARACAAAGMNVVLAARRTEALEEIAGECRRLGAEALPVRTDVRLLSDVEALFSRTLETFGRVDVLIANAGIGFHTPLAEATDVQLRDVIDVNILGVMRCARAAAAIMIGSSGGRGRGHIITVSSISAELVWPNDAVYGATKAAVHRFALSLKGELEPHGIAVTDIMPGVIDTPLTATLGDTRKADPAIVARAIVRAIESPRSVVVTPRWYGAILLLNRLVPGSVNRWLGRLGRES
jgi:short-subunit dehydrogenase